MFNFGERLRMARERKGLTQMDVCKLINISNKSLSRYETNASAPNPDIIRQLTTLYDVSPFYILGLSENMGCSNLNTTDLSNFDLSKVEKSLLNSFRLLTYPQQEHFLNNFSSIIDNQNYKNINKPNQQEYLNKHEKMLLETFNQVDDINKGRIIQFALEVLKESKEQQAALSESAQ